MEVSTCPGGLLWLEGKGYGGKRKGKLDQVKRTLNTPSPSLRGSDLTLEMPGSQEWVWAGECGLV